MSTAVLTNRLGLDSVADVTLRAAAGFWFLVAITGQWLFLYYIAAFYGPSTVTGNFQAWSKNTFLRMGYIAGDTAGNLVFAAHVLLAAVITFGGAIQLIPQIRARAIFVHRWNGRLFMLTALAVSIAGLYLVWVRGDRLGAPALTLNAVLLIALVALAWRSVLTHEISAHRRWALRTYIVANGQWFFRVGVVVSIIVSRGLGIAVSPDGPLMRFWGFGCYLLPLAVVELYLRAKESGGPRRRFAMAGGLIVLTLLMGVGIFGIAAFDRMFFGLF